MYNKIGLIEKFQDTAQAGRPHDGISIWEGVQLSRAESISPG